jgi:hypothetical protein
MRLDCEADHSTPYVSQVNNVLFGASTPVLRGEITQEGLGVIIVTIVWQVCFLCTTWRQFRIAIPLL